MALRSEIYEPLHLLILGAGALTGYRAVVTGPESSFEFVVPYLQSCALFYRASQWVRVFETKTVEGVIGARKGLEFWKKRQAEAYETFQKEAIRSSLQVQFCAIRNSI